MKHEHIGVLIKMASLEFDRKASSILSADKITPSQFKVLKYLCLQPEGSVRQIDLENFFGMTNPTVTGILQNLEKKDLISRENHPTDKRSKLIFLTDKADSAKQQILATSQEIEKSFTAKLSSEEIQTLRPLLLKLLKEPKVRTK
ncbi:MarR family winged helix-turn-helix transcriptional regulator [Streptococcus catagoni]|uniref:MarR family winged helix-turn-helix transcriptional regulator n=1 Tax=Streptococcus catagoni TaxID=2654874 RepID=UPI001408D9FF|nr:MarR family transcriptional regulator [Streptococcus catagoni]